MGTVWRTVGGIPGVSTTVVASSMPTARFSPFPRRDPGTGSRPPSLATRGLGHAARTRMPPAEVPATYLARSRVNLFVLRTMPSSRNPLGSTVGGADTITLTAHVAVVPPPSAGPWLDTSRDPGQPRAAQRLNFPHRGPVSVRTERGAARDAAGDSVVSCCTRRRRGTDRVRGSRTRDAARSDGPTRSYSADPIP
jgi:hypothetical protein